jgi:PAS domain S-box-containing protein
VGRLLAVAGTYYVGARAGLLLAEVNGQVTPLWPPTGIALAAFLVFGARVWPAVALGAFLANVAVGPVDVAAAIAVGNTAAPLVSLALLRRTRFDDRLARLRDAVTFVLLGALGGMAVSATWGTGTLVLLGGLPRSEAWTTWWVWWAGDAAGVLVFAPLLLLMREAPKLRSVPSKRWAEWALLMVASVALSVSSVLPEAGVLFVVIPLLVWAALRFGLAGAGPALLLAVVTADIAAGLQVGTFASGSVIDRMALLQAFVGVASLSALLVSALAAERRDDRLMAERALEARVQQRTEELTATVADLRRSEQRFRKLVDSAPEALVVVDPEGLITEANGKAAVLFGYAEEDLVGMSVDELIPAAHRATHAAHRAQFQAHPSDRPMGAGLTLQALRRDGVEVPIDVALSPMPGPEGQLVVVALRDITERLKAEASSRMLRETEQRSEQALEINDSVVQGLTTAAYSLDRGDTAAARRVVSATLDAARGVIANLMSPGSTVVPLPPQPDATSLKSQVPAPSPVRPVEGDVRVVIADDTEDIRALLRETLESVSGIEIVGEATNGLEAVRAAATLRPDLVLLDVSMPELNGMEALAQIRAEVPDTKVVMLSGYAQEQAAADALSLGAAAYVEKGGSLRRLITLISDLYPGRFGGVSASDVPLRRSAAPTTTNDYELDVLSTYVHELRSPLTVAMGVAEMLALRASLADGAPSADLTDRLTRSLQRISRLVDALSDAGRIGAGNLTLALEAVDVVDLVRARVRDASVALTGRAVEVSAEGEAVAPVDPFRIGQIVENLLSNAVKFSPAGSSIDVRVETRAGGIEISVSDLGPGVPEDKVHLLFGKFQRLGSRVPGSGLGLHLSREIARAHDGDLTYRPGPPCTFVLTLPRLVMARAG